MSIQDGTQTDQGGSLRRIRSLGDIPRQPDRAHIRPNLRSSEGMSDHHPLLSPDYDYTSGYRSVGVGMPPSAPPAGPSWPASGHSLALPPRHPRPSSQAAQPVDTQVHANSPATTPLNMPLYMRMLMYFGIGRRASYARKALVSLIWNVSWGFSQIVTIITILILTGTHFRSTNNPGMSEWTACDRPLGVWAILWVLRVILASILAYWDYLRNRTLALRSHSDAEATDARQGPAALHPQDHTTRHARGSVSATSTTNNPNPNHTPRENLPPLPRLYSRLTLLSSLMTLSWFLTAHILEYTSIQTCRETSPHLWWLIFGILCIMYLMILEVVILGLLVLVIAPILFIFWNIFLICIGRHPIQNPGIRPEIGKLPKSLVERIPLVMYIPPPPEEEGRTTLQSPHSYPPKMNLESPLTSERPQRRFKFIRDLSAFRSRKESNKQGHANEKSDTGEQSATENPESVSWEENWEQGEYPFVALEGNRASCAICLMDFEEPKRKNGVTGEDRNKEEEMSSPPPPDDLGGLNNGDTQAATQNRSAEPTQTPLKLADAGEGAQPLRLLACGHVFHKTCLDPWLLDVSGRCPVCQRPVEVQKPPKKFRRGPG